MQKKTDEPAAGPKQAPTAPLSAPELKAKLARFYDRFTDEASVQRAVREQLSVRRSIDPAKEAEPKAAKRPATSAGLVLIAPYLPVFLRNLGLLSPTGTFEGNGATKAAMTLHFLATGRDAETGDDLFFIQHLLGVDHDNGERLPVPAPHKVEAERLLGSIIANWPAAQSLKVAGLREAMLQRGGILEKASDTDQLQVSPHPIDVLLSSIPWGFGAVYHPWMARPMVVDWP